MGILNLAMLSTYLNVCEVLNLMQIEYYFFIHRIIIETINKMIINIRNVINKSFFFINIKPSFLLVGGKYSTVSIPYT